ncbi:DNA primase [Cocleimonas flava]|uniref:DNA primase n=1 Tax=Cocleimonas flava TaxID=634765 RepID=A0A4R1F0L5_9GAMM|nr:DNA primase [Cocleimonas flava]TCJ87323.1 DNA primase [Cocleimonas flava]
MASGRIPREFIDDLLTRADIVDVINARVPLKKKGREFTACCPFHNEKTPSFTVSPNKQFYHCFGCGVHGSAISFLMEYEHLDFVEAIESLADSMGVTVPREKGGKGAPSEAQRQRSKDLYTLLDDANQYYQLQLKGSPAAIEYLKGRELSGEISKRFNIGYSLSGWDHLLNHFKGSYAEQQLVDSGLVIKKDDGKIYDRYRDRIMFPIRNRKGQVIGFGGRVLGDDLPKYINSPETTVFHKGRELYGLYEARINTQKLDRIIVVEGYMDVIALAQFGVSYAVATLGTATTEEHIKQLFRAVPEIIFCFDGDRAGKEAAWRALENAMPVMQDGKEIKFLFLPDGEDPDTQIRKIGKDAFEENYQQADSLTAYFVENLHSRFNITSDEGKTRFLKEAAKLLTKMPDTLIKDQLVQRLSDMTNVDKKVLFQREISSNNSPKDQSMGEPKSGRSRLNNRSVSQTPIRYAISLLLSEPTLVKLIENIEEIALSKLPGSDLLTTLIEAIQESPDIKPVALLDRWKNTEFEAPLIQLMKWQPESDDMAILSDEFKDCLLQIRKRAKERKIESLLHKERTEGLSESEKQSLLVYLKNS